MAASLAPLRSALPKNVTTAEKRVAKTIRSVEIFAKKKILNWALSHRKTVRFSQRL